MHHTLTSLIVTIEKQLRSEYQDPVLREQTAWWLLEALTKRSKTQLIVQQNVELTSQEQQQLDVWIFQITQMHKPLQYILGSVPFDGLDIKVEPPILIPRPETEEWILSLIEQLEPVKKYQLAILDIGTGTGCIALALANACKNAQVTAIDINPQALELARTNAQRNGLSNVEFVESDVFKGLPRTQHFDLIVSNPPYITHAEYQALDTSVREWESPLALEAAHEGLAVIERIVAGAPDFLKEHSPLAQYNLPRLEIEIGYRQGPAVQKLMQHHGFSDVLIIQDLEGKDRIVSGKR